MIQTTGRLPVLVAPSTDNCQLIIPSFKILTTIHVFCFLCPPMVVPGTYSWPPPPPPRHQPTWKAPVLHDALYTLHSVTAASWHHFFFLCQNCNPIAGQAKHWEKKQQLLLWKSKTHSVSQSRNFAAVPASLFSSQTKSPTPFKKVRICYWFKLILYAIRNKAASAKVPDFIVQNQSVLCT